MDLIRYSLLAAIAAVALYLATQWGEFRDMHKPDYSDLAPAELAGGNEVPTAATTIQDGDIPNVAPPADESIPERSQEPQAPARNGQLIEVRTDVLTVTIDPNGGDIVAVSLPDHLVERDQPHPFVLLERNRRRTYIAQSGLIGPNGTDTAEQRPLFTTARNDYILADGSNELVVDLTMRTADQVGITKRFTFRRGDYLVDLDYLVDNDSDQPWSAVMYAQLKRDSSEDPSSASSGAGLSPFLGVATRNEDKPYIKIAFDDLADEPLRATVSKGWIAMVQHYFISAWVPGDDRPHHYASRVTSGGLNLVNFTTPDLSLAPGQSGSLSAHFYAGPKDQYRLEEIAPGLELTVDYGWLWWVAQPLFWIMTSIHSIVGNWGWSIILLTVLVKAAFYKLSASSYRSMAKMRALTPKMQQIRESYGDDRQKQSQAMMDLYKKEKVNPLGGCLPILIQMPVFIALYWVLMESVELRHAPWLGWIEDLSTMDPYYILPLVMGVSMFLQQRLNPPPPDPMQAKIMQWMPVFFTFFFLWFPAGLVLYWTVNNILSIGQQWMITRQIENATKPT